MPWMKRPKQLLPIVPGLMDSSLFGTNIQGCLWIPACSKFGLKLVLGKRVQRYWSWLWFCLHIWVFIASAHSDQATQDAGELNLSVFSQVPAVILSVLAERASASLWRSALHMNLCSEVLFLCLHRMCLHSLLRIKFRGDRTLVKCSGERQWTRMRIPPFKKCR